MTSPAYQSEKRSTFLSPNLYSAATSVAFAPVHGLAAGPIFPPAPPVPLHKGHARRDRQWTTGIRAGFRLELGVAAPRRHATLTSFRAAALRFPPPTLDRSPAQFSGESRQAARHHPPGGQSCPPPAQLIQKAPQSAHRPHFRHAASIPCDSAMTTTAILCRRRECQEYYGSRLPFLLDARAADPKPGA